MRPAISTIKLAIPACALICALALPGAAPAAKKVKKVSGEVEGDANSKVSMKIKLNKNGKGKKVKSFKWEGLDGYCDDGATFAGEQSGSVKGSTPVAQLNRFFAFIPIGPSGNALQIQGTVKGKNNNVRVENGFVLVFFNGGFCSAPLHTDGRGGSFTAKKT